jgi:uncharacterized membrane protein
MSGVDGDDPADGGPDDAPERAGHRGEQPSGEDVRVEELAELLETLDELEDTADSEAERAAVADARRHALRLSRAPAVFGNVITGFDRSDAAEAFLGAVLFGIPMMVEGGTNEVGAFLAANPLLLAATVVADVALVIGIVYVADIQEVVVRDAFFGVVPRRLVGVVGIAFGTALALTTAWGRVDWADPSVAFATAVVAAVPMAIGAALGDILPGS